MSFKRFLFEQFSQPQINLQPYEKALDAYIETLKEYEKERQYRVTNFDPNIFFSYIQKVYADYPGLPQLVQSLKSKDIDSIYKSVEQVRTWAMQHRDMEKMLGYRKIFDYVDAIGNHGADNTNWEQEKKKLMDATRQHMEATAKEIAEAISRVPNWNGSEITIEASVSQEQNGSMSLEPEQSSFIHVGKGPRSPGFAYFKYEGKKEIDDVVEGGDEDFFDTPQLQSDYFNLINSLRNPNFASKSRTLTLYTARPVSDRQQLLTSKSLPVNIFLANSYDHVEGIAAEGRRDIWKVRIDSRYLTQTLDGPVKYFQVTVSDAPAQLELIQPGE